MMIYSYCIVTTTNCVDVLSINSDEAFSLYWLFHFPSIVLVW